MNRPMGGPGRGMDFTKKGEKHKFSETWGKLISYCKPYHIIIIIALVCAIGGAAFSLMGPDKLKEIFNVIGKGMVTGIDLQAINKIGYILICFYSASVILSYTQGYIMASVTQKISRKLRTEISVKINRLPLQYFDQTSFGDVLSRVTNDVDTIGQTLNQSVGTLVTSLALLLGSVFMMFKTNAIMALVAIGSSFVGFILMMVIITNSQKYFVEQQKQLGAVNGHIEEIYSGHNVVKAYNAEEKAHVEFDSINKKLYKSAWKSQFMSGLMMPLMGFIGNFGYVAVCVVGAVMTMKGTFTFGVVIAFMVYVRLFTQPLSQIAQAATSLQSTGAASFRVFEFLGKEELPDESYKTTVLDTAKGNVEFKNVRFGYVKDKIIINDFSASVVSGQKIAIVGPTGAGKTTMVNLLMRFYETNSGNILIDGVPTTDLTRENVHNMFCMVLQDTWLFEGTIRDNVVYCKKDVTDDQVKAACKAVGIHHFIRTLPQGYDTVIGENANLSAGQRQLITIARAMIQDAPMLILDEATSSVDTRTEILIQEAMDKLMIGRTSFIIAHRLSTIKNADLILVMKDGDIIESGNHENLIQQNGFYCDLYNSQFEKEA